ncbi:MAG TPA: biotin carboxylase N-terminal domain-containing protein [Planctomycetota bacterium]|nr:biotin carboxylase N-terminal domain-containing protein [Planctomycetota bacterium]
MAKRRLKKVLVANRGEIAVRVLRTLKASGIRTVAVYSDADRGTLPVRMADEAARLGPPPSAESYLRGDLIVKAALEHGADGIHPGYGFLSENAGFARAVEKAGLAFIGPAPASIATLGDKLASRDALRSAGVPPVPGSGGAVEPAALSRLARDVGFPLLLKAVAGGGGRGIRIVRSPTELESAFETASSEARSAFGASGIIAERYLERARHVEVQVLGDGAGGVRLFFERDCSTQRRLQKVIEETPSPAVTPAIREKLLLAAGRAIASARYRGAGTLEFLLAESGEVFFLEMNTRIQVEHPVTEVTSGVDIVLEQVAIAEGLQLPRWSDDLGSSVTEPRGAAMELRVNAEDPEQGFCPSTGTVTALQLPAGPFVRVDTALERASEVTPYYDPLLAKVIAWGPDREAARLRLIAALGETQVGGVITTVPLGLALLSDRGFREGRNHCQYLAERLADPAFFPGILAEEDIVLLAAAAAWMHRAAVEGRSRGAASLDAGPGRRGTSSWGRPGGAAWGPAALEGGPIARDRWTEDP